MPSDHSDNQSIQAQIDRLEQQRQHDLQALKAQFHLTTESLKPSKLILHTISDVAASPVAKSFFVKVLAGFAVGLLTRKIVSKQKPAEKQNIWPKLIRWGTDFVVDHRFEIASGVVRMLRQPSPSAEKRKKELAGIES